MGTQAKEPFIAVVDDEAAVREATESLLRSAGYKATSFASAEDFLAHAMLERIACLILDVGLPGMSGLELQRRMLCDGARIPIVFITAHEDDSRRLEAQARLAGALAFLRKPFTGEDLLGAVRSSFKAADT